MKTISKMWRSGIAMLLAVCMVVGLVPSVALAAEEKEKDTLVYVSMGDSMTNGYCLDGYDGTSGAISYGTASYANTFASWLAGYD